MKRKLFSFIIICLFTTIIMPVSGVVLAKTQTSTSMTRQECTRRGGTYSGGTCTYEVDDATPSSSGSSSGSTSSGGGSVQGYQGHSDADCYFAGFVAWDCKIGPMNSESAIRSGIWQIAANVATDISVAAAYLVLGYTIYGGYLYMLSGGDSGKVAAGKRTLTHAFIGLAITMLAGAIMSTIRIILAAGNGGSLNCDFTTGNGCITSSADVSAMVTNTIQWFFGMAGIVAVIFVLMGGVQYMTSAGDPGKTKQAKQTILYALIGLVIVVLAEVITGFVSNLIRNSTTTSLAEPHIIATISPDSTYNIYNNIKEPYVTKEI